MNIHWKWDVPIPLAFESVLKLSEIARGFESRIAFGKNEFFINGKVSSQVASLFLTMKCGEPLCVVVEGADAREAFIDILEHIHCIMDHADLSQPGTQTMSNQDYTQAM